MKMEEEIREEDYLVQRVLDATRAGKITWKHISETADEAPKGSNPFWDETCWAEVGGKTVCVHRTGPDDYYFALLRKEKWVVLCRSHWMDNGFRLHALYDTAEAPSLDRGMEEVHKALDSAGISRELKD